MNSEVIVKTTTHNFSDVCVILPKVFDLFKIGEQYSMNRSLDGFIMKRSEIDAQFVYKITKSRKVKLNYRINSIYDVEGQYQIEQLDEDTLKFTKI